MIYLIIIYKTHSHKLIKYFLDIDLSRMQYLLLGNCSIFILFYLKYYIHFQEEGEFDWDSTVQSAILGSFYWCYILSQVVGGVLTQRFGTKTVFGFSQLTTAIASLLIPQAASFHYSAVIALRSLQGMASVSVFNKNKIVDI